MKQPLRIWEYGEDVSTRLFVCLDGQRMAQGIAHTFFLEENLNLPYQGEEKNGTHEAMGHSQLPELVFLVSSLSLFLPQMCVCLHTHTHMTS